MYYTIGEALYCRFWIHIETIYLEFKEKTRKHKVILMVSITAILNNDAYKSSSNILNKHTQCKKQWTIVDGESDYLHWRNHFLVLLSRAPFLSKCWSVCLTRIIIPYYCIGLWVMLCIDQPKKCSQCATKIRCNCLKRLSRTPTIALLIIRA